MAKQWRISRQGPVATRRWSVVGKATKSDEGGKGAKKHPKPARPATVLKPVIIGASVLAVAQAVLPKVL